jgi:hypothetical protein
MDAWPTSKAESTVMGLVEGRYRDKTPSCPSRTSRSGPSSSAWTFPEA